MACKGNPVGTDDMKRRLQAASRRSGLAAIRAAGDRFCARTNDGLTAVALALALVVATVLVNRHTDSILPSCGAETDICVDVHMIDSAPEPTA